MLKGQVFSQQIFKNQIFALFINTFLNGNNGISDNYKNGMSVTYSGSNLTIASGAVCIQGRFLEEDTSTTISAGTDNLYCKLVIEVDLDKTNTDSDFQQAYYKIITSGSGYPALTQTNIVKNNSGIYQYELARFRTSSSGISDFQDKRTFLDFDSIYDEIEQHIQDIDDGSAFVSKSEISVLTVDVTTPEPNTNIRVYDNISYPSGYNRDNCVIISLMAYNHSWESKIWSTVGVTGKSTEMGSYGLRASLRSDDIGVELYKVNEAESSKTVTIRVVLMKIS